MSARRLAIAVLGVLLLLPTTPAAPASDYGGRDQVTKSIAHRLDGRHSIGWEAVALFQDHSGNLYEGPRAAEIVQIGPRYRREVGILHVPTDQKDEVVRALRGVWFARHGSRFVVPLRNETWTVGCSWEVRCELVARIAARKLGDDRWVVVGPRGARS